MLVTRRLLVAALSFAMIAAACTSSTVEETTTTIGTTITTVPAPTSTSTSSTTTTSRPGTTSTTEALPQRPYGGVAVYGIAERPTTLNPLVPGGNSPVVDLLGQLWWAGVYKIDAVTDSLVPDIVVELPTLENGGASIGDDGSLTVRYEIRDDAVWADGTPISGQDIAFTLEVILDPANNVNTSVYEDIISHEADVKSFEYTLAVPTAQFELLFDVIIPKHDVDGTSFSEDWNTTAWVSGGPFVFEEWQDGDVIRFTRNDNYWKTDPVTGQILPYLDGIEMKVGLSPLSLVELFVRQELDIIDPPATRSTIGQLSALDGDGAVLQTVARPVWEHLAFQFGPGRFDRNPGSANSSLDFRRAVAYAIDRTRLVDEILPGRIEPLDSFVEVFAPGLSTGAWAQYAYDPDVARDLIARVKADSGAERITASFTTTADDEVRSKLAELLIEMLGDVGIELEVTLEDGDRFLDETLPLGSWDLAGWAWGTRGPGVAGLVSLWDVFDPEAPPPQGQNYYRWGSSDSVIQDESSARFAVIRDAINGSVDLEVIAPLIAEAEALLAEQVVLVPLFQRVELSAYWSEAIAGLQRVVSGPGGTWNAAFWYQPG